MRFKRLSVIFLQITFVIFIISIISQFTATKADEYIKYNPYLMRIYPWVSSQIAPLMFLASCLHFLVLSYLGWKVYFVPLHLLFWFLIKSIYNKFLLGIVSTSLLFLVFDVISYYKPEYFRKLLVVKIILSLVFISSFGYKLFIVNEPVVYNPILNRIPTSLCDSEPSDEIFEQFWKNYSDYHKQTLYNIQNSVTPMDSSRFLVFHSMDAGLGNNLLGLVSAFILAVATNRIFLVNWDLLNCNIDLLFINPDFAWHFGYFGYHAPNKMEFDKEWDNRQTIWYPYCRLCPFRSRSESGGAYDNLLCLEDFGINENKTFLEVVSSMYFGTVVAHNPYFRDIICKNVGNDVFGRISRKLLRLSPHLHDEVSKFSEKHFKTAEKVIGIQMRRTEGNSIGAEQEETFWRCAQQLSFSDPNVNQTNVKWFLATDYLPTRKKLSDLYGPNLLFYNETFPSSNDNTFIDGLNIVDRSSCQGLMGAIIDMYLVGMGNEIIISPYSTFGYLAHARTSLIPHIVTRKDHCVKLLSSQPCFQYWMGVMATPCFKPEMYTVEMLNQHDCWF